MTERLPLPKHTMLGLDQYGSPSKYGWSADQMREYAAAQSSADNAGLRAERDNMASVIAQLLADNTALQNNVVMPLRERVKVLEVVLQALIDMDDSGMGVDGWEKNFDDARAVLKDAK